MAKRVLIVDDALIMRKRIKDIAEEAGWEVAGEATNGEEAVELYQRCVVGGVNRTASDAGEVSHDVSIGSVEMEETE